MRRFFSVLLLAVSVSFNAQATRFVYEVSMKTDSTAQPVVENAFLDVSGSKSVFYGEKRSLRDSLMQRNRQTRNFSFDRSQMDQFRTQINYEIEKNIGEQQIIYKNRIARDLYSYQEDRNFNWQILPETSTIGTYKVQKAQTDFAGRKWTAWFTQDVPVMDGPYKFSGLPGLIVKIEDAKGDYSFDLKETKAIANLPELQQRGSVLTVKRKDYEKQLERFRKDPASMMQSMQRGGIRNSQRNPQADLDRKKRMEEEQRKNNNPIELS